MSRISIDLYIKVMLIYVAPVFKCIFFRPPGGRRGVNLFFKGINYEVFQENDTFFDKLAYRNFNACDVYAL